MAKQLAAIRMLALCKKLFNKKAATNFSGCFFYAVNYFVIYLCKVILSIVVNLPFVRTTLLRVVSLYPLLALK